MLRNDILQIRIERCLFRRFRKMCKAKNVTMSIVIRDLIFSFVKKALGKKGIKKLSAELETARRMNHAGRPRKK